MQGIVSAEGNYAPVRSGIMHAASPQPLGVQVVWILKVHDSEKQGLIMELLQGFARTITKYPQKHASQIQVARGSGYLMVIDPPRTRVGTSTVLVIWARRKFSRARSFWGNTSRPRRTS